MSDKPLRLEGIEWRQPSAFTRSYELVSGDDVLATLVFPKVFGSLADARWGSEAWTFKRQGFLHPRVTVRRPDSDVDIAMYEPNWTGRKAILRGPGSRLTMFVAASLFGSEHLWKTPEDVALVSLVSRGITHAGASVEVTAAGARDDQIKLLILLGWYVIRLAHEDAAASSAAVIATG